MWDNTGGKVKGLAKFLFWAGTVASVIGAIVLWAQSTRYQNNFGPGLAVLVSGFLSSMFSSWVLHAIGTAGEQAEEANNTAANAKHETRQLEKQLEQALAELKALKEAGNETSKAIRDLTKTVQSARLPDRQAEPGAAQAGAPRPEEGPVAEEDKLTLNAGQNAILEAFTECAMLMDSAIEVKNLWEEKGLDRIPDYERITKEINKTADIERMYGRFQGNVTRLIKRIGEIKGE